MSLGAIRRFRRIYYVRLSYRGGGGVLPTLTRSAHLKELAPQCGGLRAHCPAICLRECFTTRSAKLFIQQFSTDRQTEGKSWLASGVAQCTGRGYLPPGFAVFFCSGTGRALWLRWLCYCRHQSTGRAEFDPERVREDRVAVQMPRVTLTATLAAFAVGAVKETFRKSGTMPLRSIATVFMAAVVFSRNLGALANLQQPDFSDVPYGLPLAPTPPPTAYP